MNLRFLATLPISAAVGLAVGAGLASRQKPAPTPSEHHGYISAIPSRSVADPEVGDPSMLLPPASIAPLLELDSEGLIAFLGKTKQAGSTPIRTLAFRRLMEIDLEIAFRWYCAQEHRRSIYPRSFLNLRHKLLYAFAEIDIDAALEACMANRSGQRFVDQQAGRRLCLDLKRAPSLDWFTRMRTRCEDQQRFFELRGILQVAITFMPEEDARQLRDLYGDGAYLPKTQLPYVPLPPAPSDTDAYRQWLTENPGEWPKLLSHAPETIREKRGALVEFITAAPPEVLEAHGKELVAMISTRSPDEAVQFAESLPGSQRGEALGYLFQSHGSHYGRRQFALRILERNRDDQLLASIASEVIHDWASGGSDPYLALQAAQLLPEGVGPPADVFSSIMARWSATNLLEAIAALDDPRVAPHFAKARDGILYRLQSSTIPLEKALAHSPLDETRKDKIRAAHRKDRDGEASTAAIRELIDSVRDQSR